MAIVLALSGVVVTAVVAGVAVAADLRRVWVGDRGAIQVATAGEELVGRETGPPATRLAGPIPAPNTLIEKWATHRLSEAGLA